MKKYLHIYRENENMVKVDKGYLHKVLGSELSLLTGTINRVEFIDFVRDSLDECKYIIFDVDDDLLTKTVNDLVSIVGIDECELVYIDDIDGFAIDLEKKSNKYSLLEILV